MTLKSCQILQIDRKYFKFIYLYIKLVIILDNVKHQQ